MSADRYGSSTVRRRRTPAEIEELHAAIVEAVEEDHPVSLRGVFYRVESARVIDKTELDYRAVGRELLKLRRAGTVPYHWITDGTRWVTRPRTYTGIDAMLADAAATYRRALWHDQDVDVQIFTEKDAISGVILPVTDEWDVPLGVLRGYSSESFAHSVAEGIRDNGKSRTYVYQLGDHDPSGVDAWRSFRERVAGFLGGEVVGLTGLEPEGSAYTFGDGRTVVFAWLAITARQIADLRLPTRPTKRTDPRASGHSGGSVEVDAIPARLLRALVDNAITEHIDGHQLAVTRAAEQSEREIFARMHSRLTEHEE